MIQQIRWKGDLSYRVPQNYTSVFGTVVDKNLFEDLQEHAPKAAHKLKGAKGLVPVLLETEPATVTVSVR
jgi:hypothetical protein